jgi:single-strand DNA-binding protein
MLSQQLTFDLKKFTKLNTRRTYMSFNKIILIGNLGQDPELRYTPSGVAVCSFSLATNEKRRDNTGEMQDVTTWFRVTLWREKAENASKYLEKGRPVYIEGRLRLSEWTDRDNNTRQTLEVTGTEMQFIGGRSNELSAAAGSSSANEFSDTGNDSRQKQESDTPTDDDIPF